MRRLMLWSAVAGFTACLLRPTLVAITPEYGYQDGCTDVILSGHHLGTAAKAKVRGDGGEADIPLTPAEESKKRPDWAQDVGFVYYATMPPSPSGTSGWYDIVATVEDEELVIRQGWYYKSCPATFVVDTYEVPPYATTGSIVTFAGCGLSSEVTLELLDAYTEAFAASVALVSDCSTAEVHATIPDTLPEGTYTMQLVHPDGTSFVLESCFSESGDTGTTCIPDVVTVGAP